MLGMRTTSEVLIIHETGSLILQPTIWNSEDLPHPDSGRPDPRLDHCFVSIRYEIRQRSSQFVNV